MFKVVKKALDGMTAEVLGEFRQRRSADKMAHAMRVFCIGVAHPPEHIAHMQRRGLIQNECGCPSCSNPTHEIVIE